MPLVALHEQVINTRGVFDRGRAGVVKLGVAPKGRAPRFGQLNGVAFVIYVNVPAVHLIAVNVASRELCQVGGRACGGNV